MVIHYGFYGRIDNKKGYELYNRGDPLFKDQTLKNQISNCLSNLFATDTLRQMVTWCRLGTINKIGKDKVFYMLAQSEWINTGRMDTNSVILLVELDLAEDVSMQVNLSQLVEHLNRGARWPDPDDWDTLNMKPARDVEADYQLTYSCGYTGGNADVSNIAYALMTGRSCTAVCGTGRLDELLRVYNSLPAILRRQFSFVYYTTPKAAGTHSQSCKQKYLIYTVRSGATTVPDVRASWQKYYLSVFERFTQFSFAKDFDTWLNKAQNDPNVAMLLKHNTAAAHCLLIAYFATIRHCKELLIADNELEAVLNKIKEEARE